MSGGLAASASALQSNLKSNSSTPPMLSAAEARIPRSLRAGNLSTVERELNWARYRHDDAAVAELSQSLKKLRSQVNSADPNEGVRVRQASLSVVNALFFSSECLFLLRV